MSSPHQAPTGGPAPAPSGASAARAAQAVHTGSSASPHTGPNTHTVNTMQAGSSESAAAPAQASRPEQASHPEKAAVIFSGGQDSTTCLFLALRDFGRDNVEVITFQYGQRHAIELEKARWIAQDLGVKQTVIDTSVIRAITHNALLDGSVRNRLQRLSGLPGRVHQVDECHAESGHGLSVRHPHAADVADQEADLGTGRRTGRLRLHSRAYPHLLPGGARWLPRMSELRAARTRAAGVSGRTHPRKSCCICSDTHTCNPA